MFQDVPRTFPGHTWIESLEGQRRLENVLLAYSMHNPRVGYCQSMNYIAATLLIAMEKNEERVFFMMMALIEHILYEGTYEPNLIGCQIEMKSLGVCFIPRQRITEWSGSVKEEGSKIGEALGSYLLRHVFNSHRLVPVSILYISSIRSVHSHLG